jgi:protein involved in polysaccharide export with SLBB domain
MTLQAMTLVALSACGSSTRAAESIDVQPPEPAPLEPGDAIAVTFSREPEQNGTYRVDESSTVSLPFLGLRTVGGMRPDEVEATLRADYDARLRNQTIDIRLLRRVRVLGSVRQPGLYQVDGTMTIADVVAEAGGATENGDVDSIEIMREGSTVRTEIGMGAGALTYLRSGDEIFVPQRGWFSRNGVILVSAVVSATAIIAAAAFY